jgi:hypothetical protein
MSGPSDQKDAARRKAQNHFAASEQRDNSVKQEIARARAQSDAKTAKLRALRLAKEAEEKVEADKKEAERIAQKAKGPAAKKPRVRRSVTPG